MQFEWDDEKNRINKKKHGISFETAAKVFTDPRYIEIYDSEHSLGEDQYIAIGLVEDVLFVVFAERRHAIRLISSRLATEVER